MFYIQFNDTNVPEFEYTYYGSPDIKHQYPEIEKLRYPKAGAPNPEFSEIAFYTSNGKHSEPIRFPVARDAR